MSSDSQPAISISDMTTIRSVLFRAGYGSGSPVNGEFRADTATAMLVEKVRVGESSPAALERHLSNSYGRPDRELELFVPILPRFAIQGLPS